MPETSHSLPYAQTQRASYGAVLSQTMFLVAIAIGFLIAGSAVGRDLTQGTAMACTIGAVVLLLGQNFVPAFRHGPVAMGMLFVIALLIGLGLGPVLAYYVSTQPDVVTKAAATTALVVVAAGTGGSLVAKDLSAWMKPVSIALLIAVAASWIMFVAGGSGGFAGDLVSLAIGAVSAVAIVIYFNVLRHQATEDDVVWLATGIFVGIVNIFLTMLNLFGSR